LRLIDLLFARSALSSRSAFLFGAHCAHSIRSGGVVGYNRHSTLSHARLSRDDNNKTLPCRRCCTRQARVRCRMSRTVFCQSPTDRPTDRGSPVDRPPRAVLDHRVITMCTYATIPTATVRLSRAPCLRCPTFVICSRVEVVESLPGPNACAVACRGPMTAESIFIPTRDVHGRSSGTYRSRGRQSHEAFDALFPCGNVIFRTYDLFCTVAPFA